MVLRHVAKSEWRTEEVATALFVPLDTCHVVSWAGAKPTI